MGTIAVRAPWHSPRAAHRFWFTMAGARPRRKPSSPRCARPGAALTSSRLISPLRTARTNWPSRFVLSLATVWIFLSPMRACRRQRVSRTRRLRISTPSLLSMFARPSSLSSRCFPFWERAAALSSSLRSLHVRLLARCRRMPRRRELSTAGKTLRRRAWPARNPGQRRSPRSRRNRPVEFHQDRRRSGFCAEHASHPTSGPARRYWLCHRFPCLRRFPLNHRRYRSGGRWLETLSSIERRAEKSGIPGHERGKARGR
jgi:hypothetical protein